MTIIFEKNYPLKGSRVEKLIICRVCESTTVPSLNKAVVRNQLENVHLPRCPSGVIASQGAAGQAFHPEDWKPRVTCRERWRVCTRSVRGAWGHQ